MKPLDSKLLKKFLNLAANRLEGEWILIGGTVLPILGIDHRTTVDIDLIPISKKDSNSSILELMRLAEELGLPIETLNQAGLYFLEKIDGYRNFLILLKKGKTASIYRPNIDLYLRLKLKRFSESDYLDCITFIKYAKKIGEEMEIPRLISEVRKEISRSGTQIDKKLRLNNFLEILQNEQRRTS